MAAPFASKLVGAAASLVASIKATADAALPAEKVKFVSGLTNGTDCSAIVQAAIDAAAGTFITLHLGRCDIILDNITLRAGVSLVGDSVRGTIIRAKSGSTNPVFKLGDGPIVDMRLNRLWIIGNATAGQTALYLYGRPIATSPFHGGCWHCQFSQLLIENFEKCIWLRGGTDNYLLPNQFLSFSDVKTKTIAGNEARALLITGQAGQVTFRDCVFDGAGISSTNCVIELGREFRNGAAVGGSLSPSAGVSAGGVEVSDIHPANVSFEGGCAIQEGIRAIYINRCFNISVRGCWFENTQYGVYVEVSSYGIVVDSNHFANAGDNGVGTGALFYMGSTSVGSFTNNEISGAFNRVITGNGHHGVTQFGNIYPNLTNPGTAGVISNVGVVSNAISTQARRQVLVQNAATINTINSFLFCGDRITVYCIAAVTFSASGGNIKIGSKTTATCANGDCAVFEFDDIYRKWNYVGGTATLA